MENSLIKGALLSIFSIMPPVQMAEIVTGNGYADAEKGWVI